MHDSLEGDKFYFKLLVQALSNQDANPGMEIRLAATYAVLDAFDISNQSTDTDHQIAHSAIDDVVKLYNKTKGFHTRRLAVDVEKQRIK